MRFRLLLVVGVLGLLAGVFSAEPSEGSDPVSEDWLLELGRGLSRPAGQQGVDILGPELVSQHHRQGPLSLHDVGGGLAHYLRVAPAAQ